MYQQAVLSCRSGLYYYLLLTHHLTKVLKEIWNTLYDIKKKKKQLFQ